MRKLFNIISVIFISCLLSSCFAAALFGAGAGAGYIYAKERGSKSDSGKKDSKK